MHELERARELARTMVALGTDSGVATTALITDMDTPLGRAVGNANEVRESVEVLAGGGPADVVELTVALAREMLALAGQPDADVEAALADGRAMDVWRAMIRAQDGDPEAALPAPHETHTVTAAASGVLTRLDAWDVGIAAWRLGAGRARPQDAVVHAAGIELHAKPGDSVVAGQPLLTLAADDAARIPRALEALENAYSIGEKTEPRPIVIERITA
jgi:thymidine phosphorylase